MRKTILCLCFILGTVIIMAASYNPQPSRKASEIYLSVNTSGKKISLRELSTITTTDFQTLTGHKMNIANRIAFKWFQRDLRKCIQPDGTVNEQKLGQVYKDRVVKNDFHLGGFALGVLLGPIGVLIAYLIKDDKKKKRVKWAWLGLAAVIVIGIFSLVIF